MDKLVFYIDFIDIYFKYMNIYKKINNGNQTKANYSSIFKSFPFGTSYSFYLLS